MRTIEELTKMAVALNKAIGTRITLDAAKTLYDSIPIDTCAKDAKAVLDSIEAEMTALGNADPLSFNRDRYNQLKKDWVDASATLKEKMAEHEKSANYAAYWAYVDAYDKASHAYDEFETCSIADHATCTYDEEGV